MEACFFELLCDKLKAVKVKLCITFEFICTVACSDCYCERINACTFYKVNSLIGVCVCCIPCCNFNIIFNTGKLAELGLNNNSSFVSIVNDFFCFSYILFIIKM